MVLASAQSSGMRMSLLVRAETILAAFVFVLVAYVLARWPCRKENTPRGYGGELKECGRSRRGYEGEPVGVLSVMYRHVESPTRPKSEAPKNT